MPPVDDADQDPHGLAAALADVTAQLERAHGDRGIQALVVPAVAPVFGPLLSGTCVVSVGPWPLQRSLLMALLAHLPRRAWGAAAQDVDSAPPVTRQLVIAPDAARDLVLHALAQRARVLVDHLRHGLIERHQWGPLADAARALTALPIEILAGEPHELELRFDEGSVRWQMAMSFDDDAHGRARFLAPLADVVVHLSADEDGIGVRALDGRTEPPVVRRAHLREDRLVPSPKDADRACAADDASRRAEERALEVQAALDEEAAWTEGGTEDAQALWRPPVMRERGPSDR